ncbi:hypothetical protein DLM45_04770 [Hyphomicrobium methylovorum]|nr:hypothetical protein [Hyphomicrobium methylovorum]
MEAIMAYSTTPTDHGYAMADDPADHLSAAEYQNHLDTYHGFVRTGFIFAAHILAVLLLLYFFFVK